MKPKVVKASELIKLKASLKRDWRNYLIHYGYPPTHKGMIDLGGNESMGGDSYDALTRLQSQINIVSEIIDRCRLI